jgi:hypothetical protein
LKEFKKSSKEIESSKSSKGVQNGSKCSIMFEKGSEEVLEVGIMHIGRDA